MAVTDFSKIECLNFDVLWERAASEMSNIMHHPFILSTITGTLPLSGLANYLRDEAYILTALSQVLNNQPVSTSLIKLSNCVQNLRKFSRNGEMQNMSGDHLSDITQVSVSAKELKAFLLEQALSGDGLKVVSSCLVILQARKVLESTIANHIPSSAKGPNVFQLWISAYASSEFQISATLLAEDLDTKLFQNVVSADQLNQLEYAISTTLGHQLRVFDSASAGNLLMIVGKSLHSSPWYAHRLLFTTDYDVTCTVKDTCEILVALADSSLKVYGGVESLDREQFTKRDLRALYWSLLDVHDQRIKECLADPQNVSLNNNSTQQLIEMMPSIASGNSDKIRDMDALYMLPGMDPLLEPLVTTLAQDYRKVARSFEGKPGGVQKRLAYNDSGLREVLKLLGSLEKKVNQEIMASCVLRGTTRKEIRGAAKRISLRKGCAHVLLRLMAGGTPIHLISANWSRDLIAGGLPSLPEGRLYVHSNDLQYDLEGVSDGTFPGVVQDASDKETILGALRLVYSSCNSDHISQLCHALQSQPYSSREMKNESINIESGMQSPASDNAALESKMAVFFGDSPNDLLALLDADLGIVFGQNKALRLLLSTYNVKLLPLVVASAQISLSYSEKDPVSFRHSGLLFEAASWADVEACLFGHCDIPETRWPVTTGFPCHQIFHSQI
ncbi:hypothetical protein O6H91_04G066700 [Diphasiastrum complanatum]|uniref:Uncharacterized protein n=1 Tax=Diphasiastrum complanatum TaxID=34168 RepID=A0ACC2DXQ9_DIPCM|nr:hypothetical protein O6H91_04G066700 [Diphasiastrum complanatum]